MDAFVILFFSDVYVIVRTRARTLFLSKKAQNTRGHVTPPPWGALLPTSWWSAPLLLFPPPLPPSWLHCRCLFRGLAWSERCLVKSTRAPYHLCKCTVPWMFHANRHVLFKQLWGYPQKVARKLLSVLPVSFPLKTPQWAVQHWDSGTTHSHPASSSHFICICLKAAFYLNDQMHVVFIIVRILAVYALQKMFSQCFK